MARQDDYMKTALRLPRDLHDRLMGSAAGTGTSLNTEMVRRLSDSFSPSTSSDRVAELEGIAQQQAQAMEAMGRQIDNLKAMLKILRDVVDKLSRATGGEQESHAQDVLAPTERTVKRVPRTKKSP